MILQQLYEDSDALLAYLGGKPPAMYDNLVVRWQIHVSLSGAFEGVIPLGDKGERHVIPYNYGRSVDIVPNLLVDTADYALGLLDEKNGAKKHAAFRELVSECAKNTGDVRVKAVETFLANGGVPSDARYLTDIKQKDRVMFVVNGKEPSKSGSVRGFWDERTTSKYKGNLKQQGTCLISGNDGYLETILPCEIGIGGESAPLISVNEDAGCSYGFTQALNGAVSRKAAEGFTKALNALMRGEKTHLSILSGTPPKLEVMYVFWTKRGPDDEVHSYLYEPESDPDQMNRLLNSPRNSQERVADTVSEEFPDRFYALAISGNKTRAVFRDWLSLTSWQVRENLRRWFVAQHMVAEDGGGWGKFYSIYQLAACVYRDPRKELKKAVPSSLFRAALGGDPIPRRLLGLAVLRCRVAHRVTHVRATLLKMALVTSIKDHTAQEEAAAKMSTLDVTNTQTPYICGRLLALLESLQYTAQGSLNSTVIDRFFSAAAATPRCVLTMLIQKAEKAHLPKIRRQKGIGLYLELKDQLGQIIGSLSETHLFPVQFGLDEQALFLLGYYHQRAAYRADQKDAIARRAAKNAKNTPAGTSGNSADQGEE